MVQVPLVRVLYGIIYICIYREWVPTSLATLFEMFKNLRHFNVTKVTQNFDDIYDILE